jgi:hypothetical protein
LSAEGITEESLIKDARDLLRADSFDAILRSNFFYIHSFYNDSDFLITYFRSTKEEREELANYIAENLRDRNFRCCISAKYQPSGNFNRNMLADESRVFLLTLLFVQAKDVNLGNIYQVFTDNFKDNVANLSVELVLNYLREHKDVFDPIFIDILELEEIEMAVSEDVAVEIIKIGEIDKRDKPEEYIDETSEEGRLKIKAVYSIRKRQARILSEYSCALEKINNCRPIYFTAKINGKNYLELHHLIPREFRNDFSYSIEVLANYITLCPRCHRQIHFAVDRERKHLINALYDERKDRLAMVGLGLDLNGIYEYYKVEP